MLVGMVLYVGSIAAGTYDQLWDYRTAQACVRTRWTRTLLFFIRALMNANAGGEKMIRLPDGIYDLGPLALTTTILNKH